MANTAKTSKATKETKENVATSNSNFEAIMKLAPKAITSTSRSSVYKAELFQGLDDKQKKTLRRKLRRNRESFISSFLESQKDKAKLQALQEQWKTYASQVYNDINHIFESNTEAGNQDCCKKFIAAMAQDYNK